MKATRLWLLLVVIMGALFAAAIITGSMAYGTNSGVNTLDTLPPFVSTVELRGLQKGVNGISSRYVITNQSSMTGTLLHSYYDYAGNPVGETWISQLPAFASQIYSLDEIESIPTGYTGYAIIVSDALITGTVLPPSPWFVYLPLVLREPPPGVHILNNHFAFVDTLDSLHIIGEVRNSTNSYLRFIKITANIFNSGGQLLDTEFTSTYLENLPPGDKTCFHVIMQEPSGWAYYAFEPPVYSADGNPPPNLTVFNDSGSYKSGLGWYEIIGQVRNDHGARVEYVSVVGTLYNASGTVVGCDFTFVNSTHLDPGQTSSFKMIFSGRDYADVTSYRIQVEGSPR